MKPFQFGSRDVRRAEASENAAPPRRCPACQSTSIGTTTRNPGEDAYWRCVACGEIWNAARREAGRRAGSSWQ